MTQPWSEQALLLGPRKSLVAIVTKPTAAPPVESEERPMVVILNSGIVHRVGANRMTVQLTRMLANVGYTTARFDLSGIGDSEQRVDALSPIDAAMADIREALDSLEATRKVRRFVLVGLCSGANHAAIYAGTDDRVVSVVLLEPSVPPPLLHHVHHFGRHAFRLQSWVSVLRGKNPRVEALRKRIASKLARLTEQTEQVAETDEEKASDLDGARQPHISDPEVRAYLENCYRRLLERNLPLLVVLTGESWYYRESFLHAFPKLQFGKQLELRYFGDADHVFTSRASAAEVTRLIVGWTQRTMTPGIRHGA